MVTHSVDATDFAYFFWLPAGKDEFGFRQQDWNHGGTETAPPLQDTARYRTDTPLEATISNRLAATWDAKKDSDGLLAGMKRSDSLAPRDAELGLRKIEYNFAYAVAPDHLSDKRVINSIEGRAFVFSNGLYLWAFSYTHERRTPDESRAQVRRFLRDDFVPNHVGSLFMFGWCADGQDSLQTYDGALSYYQLDTLFNGVFDGNAHPHKFLSSSTTAMPPKPYTVERVINSASMMCVDHDYLPLFDQRKDYSLRGTATSNPDSFLDLRVLDAGRPSVTLLTPGPRKMAARGLLLARLTNAAMEHHLRVAITFGVTHYRAGMAFCRAELTNQALISRLNRGSGEFRRPSLTRDESQLAELDSYQSLLAGKLPVFSYLKQLVEDMHEVSRPSKLEKAAAKRVGEAEWAYSEDTLNDAVRQYERQIESLSLDLGVVENNLAAARMERVLAELTEARKIAEIESEAPPREVVVRRRGGADENKLVVRLSILALVFAGLQVYGGVGVWLMDALLAVHPEGWHTSWWRLLVSLGQWLALGGLASWFWVWTRRRQLYPVSSDQPEEGVPLESHVYDYSTLREDITGRTDELVGELSRNMMAADGSDVVACAMRSTFRETPSNGVERVKHSLQSPATDSGVSYTLHVEVETRHGAQHEQLRDIRIVFRSPVGAPVDTYLVARRIVRRTLSGLVLGLDDEATVRKFCQDRFGWEDRLLT